MTRMTIKTIAGALLLGTALSFAAAPAFAEDAATPAAPATDAAAAPAADPAAAPAQPSPDAVVATVGDQTITEADLSFAAEDLQKELQQVPADQRRAFLVTVLIDMKVMAKAARDAGMDQDALFKRRVAYLEDRTLRRSYFSDKIAAGVTEDTIKAAYDKYVAAFKPEEQIHARHILVATEDEAKAVKADLDGGKPFEVEAMDKTTDPSGKQNGGDLGFFGKGQMVPEFEAAAWALQPGQISEPVKSQFGWHVIKLEEKKMSEPQPITQMAQQLGQQAMFEAYDVAIAGFKAAMPVNIPDAALAEQVKKQSEPQAGQ
ncbi:peptidylprolyl isomerase [Devosia sp.]|uniref:peptidylprolyl isomerase n=1 Tax=Devosia sp. TaxID=1871048 RepID=UPI003BAC542F